jgi:hypothetical protein
VLEITKDDIALLSDTDLRTLIGLLCESEVRSCGFSAVAVTWSGHQNSVDGGLDVRVALAEGETIEGFVPRPQTGFQVKKSAMQPAKILDEMQPKRRFAANYSGPGESIGCLHHRKCGVNLRHHSPKQTRCDVGGGK